MSVVAELVHSLNFDPEWKRIEVLAHCLEELAALPDKLQAELPGIRKEDLEITLTGNRLVLEAKREFKEEEKKEE